MTDRIHKTLDFPDRMVSSDYASIEPRTQEKGNFKEDHANNGGFAVLECLLPTQFTKMYESHMSPYFMSVDASIYRNCYP